MSDGPELVVNAWLIASADLNIQLTVPFSLVRSTGEQVPYLLLIHGFGSKLGTLLCTTDDEFEDAGDVAEANGYYSSALNPLHYSAYNRRSFIETLRDWGWRRNDQPPSWYKPATAEGTGAG